MVNGKVTYEDNLNNQESFNSELSKIEKENNFQVPENYFIELPQLIQDKIALKESDFNIEGMLFNFIKPYRAIALGSLLVLLILGLFFITNLNQDEFQISNDISFDDLIHEYPDMIENMDDQLLIEFAAAWMEKEDLDYFDFDYGFDSIQLHNEVFLQLSDDEISEIIFNL